MYAVIANGKSIGKSRPVKIPTDKRLTIGQLCYYYAPVKDAPPNSPSRPVAVPWVQMRGRWLKEMGFVIGAKFRVDVSPGRLVLTVEEE